MKKLLLQYVILFLSHIYLFIIYPLQRQKVSTAYADAYLNFDTNLQANYNNTEKEVNSMLQENMHEVTTDTLRSTLVQRFFEEVKAGAQKDIDASVTKVDELEKKVLFVWFILYYVQ
jgi:hypothetical protein